MNDLLKLKIEKLPTCPGCYLMKSEGRIIYVARRSTSKTASASILPIPRAHTVKVTRDGGSD